MGINYNREQSPGLFPNDDLCPGSSKRSDMMAVEVLSLAGGSGGGAPCQNPKGTRNNIHLSTDTTTNPEDSMASPPPNEVQRKRVLLSTSTPLSDTVVRSLFRDPDIDLRIIAQEDAGQENVGVNVPFYEDVPSQDPRKTYSSTRKWLNTTAARLADWADMLILAPADSGTLGAMIVGLTSTLTLTILRGWDVSKTILLVPSMTLGEWKAPLTKRQLNEIRTLWPWAKILPPVFSRFEPPNSLVEMPWEGREMFYEEIRKGLGWQHKISKLGAEEGPSRTTEQVSTANMNGHTPDNKAEVRKLVRNGERSHNGVGSPSPMRRRPDEPALPFELLTMIMEASQDWELATAVGLYAKIPIPDQWKSLCPDPKTPSAPLSLEYTILKRPFREIKEKLSALPHWKPLSNIAAHLILKLCRLDILDYIMKSRNDLYWATTTLSTLPLRVSSTYGNIALLDWWLSCPNLPTNDYLPDAVDGASRAGFIHVLDWWRTSGLPLRYTERALESASAEGQTAVLDWWKRTSDTAPGYDPVPLKIGKSVLLAAQSGRTASLEWWDKSGIAFSHAESVTRIASTHGHVPVLNLWYELKGSKLIFDNQVLVGPTKNGHVEVLEWWRRSGLRVEFKTCDIEEALEDAVSGAEARVRTWWERNGLNLGVGPDEWMKVKVL